MTPAGFKTRHRNKLLLGAVVLLGLSAAGCTIERQPRGYVFDEEVSVAILPGLDNMTSVQASMGSPSLKGTFDQGVWYYISELTRRRSFFKAHAVERNILAVEFNDEGVVASTRTYTLADALDINPRKEKTPTRGKKLGIFEQIFSNIGRFSSADIPPQ